MLKLSHALALGARALGAGSAWAHEAHGAQRHRYDASKLEDTSFGREGDPMKGARTVTIDMAKTMRFTPSTLTIQRGETVRFACLQPGHWVPGLTMVFKVANAQLLDGIKEGEMVKFAVERVNGTITPTALEAAK